MLESDIYWIGECPIGWKDGSGVGLGCLYADTSNSTTQTDAFKICQGFGEGGRLVEILNEEQTIFLQNMLGTLENDSALSEHVGWWIGLDDKDTEGVFRWPVAGIAEYTHWDIDEPERGKMF